MSMSVVLSTFPQWDPREFCFAHRVQTPVLGQCCLGGAGLNLNLSLNITTIVLAMKCPFVLTAACMFIAPV